MDDTITAPTVYRSYVAVGDSFTEGMCDELLPDGQYRGWADRVAAALAGELAAERPGEEFRYANLAVRGKLIGQIHDEQIDRAAAMGGELVTLAGGLNDVLRPGCDIEQVKDLLGRAATALLAGGGTVVMFTSTDPTRRLSGSTRLLPAILGMKAFVEGLAKDHPGRLHVVDLFSAPCFDDRRLWDEDRLHLSPEGHRRVAEAVLEALGRPARFDWRAPLPPGRPARPRRAPARRPRLAAPPPRPVDRPPPDGQVVRRRAPAQARRAAPVRGIEPVPQFPPGAESLHFQAEGRGSRALVRRVWSDWAREPRPAPAARPSARSTVLRGREIHGKVQARTLSGHPQGLKDGRCHPASHAPRRGDTVRAKRLTAALATLGLLTGMFGLTAAATATAQPAADATAQPAAAAAAAAVPRPDHVVLVIFENTSAGSIIGSPDAPYFNQLANSGANFTNAFAIEHPSEPNYLDLFSGSNQGVTDDSCPHTFGTANEGAQLIAKGLTFTGYSENLPSAGSTVCTAGTSGYARKHNPWVNFSNVPAASNQPFSAFPTDFTKLPTVSWVVPNLCNDMHDCSTATGDAWLKANLDGYVQWAKSHNSVLITTFDEDDSSGNNRIATIFDGQPVKPGAYSEHVDHFGVLRTIEDMYGLPYAGAAANATSITDAWNTGTTGTVTVTSPGNQTGTVGTAASLQINATDTAGGTLGYSATGLPAGLSINPSTGLISGTPSTAATSTVTVTATDSTGPSGSATFTWTVNPVSTGCTAAQLLGNPGFETGTATPWTATSGVLDNSSSEPAHSGSWKAWLDGYGSSHTDTLAQTVTIPAGCANAALSFWLHIDTAETGSTVYDTLKLQAVNGSTTTTLATYSNVDATTGYAQRSFSLAPYVGKTVTLKFTGTEDSSAQTSFVVDDAALNVS